MLQVVPKPFAFWGKRVVGKLIIWYSVHDHVRCKQKTEPFWSVKEYSWSIKVSLLDSPIAWFKGMLPATFNDVLRTSLPEVFLRLPILVEDIFVRIRISKSIQTQGDKKLHFLAHIHLWNCFQIISATYLSNASSGVADIRQSGTTTFPLVRYLTNFNSAEFCCVGKVSQHWFPVYHLIIYPYT